MSIYVSLLTAGTNNHEETSENANAIATDFVSEGVIGAITNTSGVAPSTGAFATNAQGTPDMTVKVSSGVAYIAGTPTSQDSQTFRVRMTADQNVTISSNTSGVTKYDWVYIKLDADKLANPAVNGDDAATLVTSRSSSSSSDDGTPPTYGYCIAVVSVADSLSSVTNGNITDKRALASSEQDGAVTGPKLDKIKDVVQFKPSVNADYSGTSMGDYVTVGSVTIPSWCTKIYVDVSITGIYPVTGSGSFSGRIKIGSDTGITFVFFGTNSALTTYCYPSISDTISPSATGSQSVVLQAQRNSGSNACRIDTSSYVTVSLSYTAD